MKKNRGDFSLFLLLLLSLPLLFFATESRADEPRLNASDAAMVSGRYRLRRDPVPHSVFPFSELKLTYRLRGEGEAPKVSRLLPKAPGLASKYSVEKSDHDDLHEVLFHYTLLVGDTNLTIPETVLKGYDPQQKRYYTLRVPAANVTVEDVDFHEILDPENSLPLKPDISGYLHALYMLLLFAAGFLSARYLPRLRNYLKMQKERRS